MSIREKFLSQNDPQHAYAYSSSEWSGGEINPRFRMFQTYGDGLTQHSGDWAITREHVIDYFESLAVVLLTNQELAESVQYLLSTRPDHGVIDFAAGVVWKESDANYDKHRYFSVSEKKITSNRDKQHDKRYQEIGKHHDGSPAAIYSMIVPEYADGLQRYLYADAVRTWALAQPDRKGHSYYMEMPPVFLKWFTDREASDNARRLRDAIDTCSSICEAYRLRTHAESMLENMTRNRARVRTMAESDAADAVGIDVPEITPTA